MNATAALPELIFGEVIHHRLRPVEHRLTYPIFSLRIPLSAIALLPKLGVALNRFGWVSFAERDHGARDGSPLEPWIRRILDQHRVKADRIDLVCFPRMLGYAFKPVSFWVCSDSSYSGTGEGDDGSSRNGTDESSRGHSNSINSSDGGSGSNVRAVLAEVHNTFGEAHNYLLVNDDRSPLRSGQALHADKVFHVSPFLGVEGGYTFRFHFGPGRWLARIDYADASGPVLTTSMSGVATPMTPMAVFRACCRFPLQALGTIARIHWNAVLLWLKSVPVFSKPRPPAEETTR